MKLSRIYIKDNNSHHRVNSAILIEGIGIKGNSPPRDSHKQISIFSEEGRMDLDSLVSNGLCTRRFQEDITIEGLMIPTLLPGDKLTIGQVVIEITRVGKKCYGDCPLINTKSPCPLRRGIIFARVLKTGPISVGDMVIKY